MLCCDVGSSVLCDIYKKIHIHFYLVGRYWKVFGKGKASPWTQTGVNQVLFAAKWEHKNSKWWEEQGIPMKRPHIKTSEAHSQGCASAGLAGHIQMAKKHSVFVDNLAFEHNTHLCLWLLSSALAFPLALLSDRRGLVPTEMMISSKYIFLLKEDSNCAESSICISPQRLPELCDRSMHSLRLTCFGVISNSPASFLIALRVIALDILEPEQLFKHKLRNQGEACVQGLSDMWGQKDTALGKRNQGEQPSFVWSS